MSLASLLLTLLLSAAPTDGLPEQVVVPELRDLRPPTAAEKQEATREYARSAELYEAGDQAGALAAAERLYAIMPNASTSLVRAQLLSDSGRPCAAFVALAVALDMDPTDKERSAIVAALQHNGKACKPGAAWARVKVVPEDAQVRIAGRDVPGGRTVVLEAGVHAVEVEAPGYARLRASLRANPGEEVPAHFETERLQAALPASTQAQPGKAKDKPWVAKAAPTAKAPVVGAPSKTMPWLLTGGGAALAAGGLGMHIWGLNTASDAKAHLSPRDDMGDEERKKAHADLSDDASKRATTAYILYGAGAVALGAGVYWLLTMPEGEGATAIAPAPWLVPGGVGISLSGRL
jgi:hypothetical protein